MWYVALTREQSNGCSARLSINERLDHFSLLPCKSRRIQRDLRQFCLKRVIQIGLKAPDSCRNEKEVQALAEKMAALPIKFKTC